MKLFILCLLLTVFHASGSIYSQNNSFNLNYRNITVSEALTVLESNSEYKFLYRSDMIDLNRKVNLLAADKRVDEVLSMIFPEGNASFRFFEDNLVAITTEHYAEQQHVVTGRVTDASTGNPLPGASILLRGTTIGTTADIDGNYRLEVPSRDVVLVFSFIGYISREIPVGDQNVINVELEEELTMLDEVVAIGYGTMRRSDLTGSVSQVTGDVIARQAVTRDPIEILQGKVPGLDVTMTNNRPGEASTFTIRGFNSLTAGNAPLIVVDGAAYGGRLTDLNASDIETIDVLKDASSTAIYGARGANGVIIITTKRAEMVEKVTVSYDGYSGFYKIFPRYDLMNGREWADMKAAYLYHMSFEELFTPRERELYHANGGVDWQERVFSGTGYETDNNLSMNFGRENVSTNVSIGYHNNQSIVDHMAFERFTGRITGDVRLSESFDIGYSAMLTSSKRDTGTDHIFSNSTTVIPLGWDYELDGTPAYFVSDFARQHLSIHPRYATSPYVEAQQMRERVFANLFLNWQISNNFSFRTSFTPDRQNQESGQYLDPMSANRNRTTSSMNYSQAQSTYLTFTNILRYQNQFGDHRIDGQLMHDQQSYSSNSVGLSGLDVPYYGKWYNVNEAPEFYSRSSNFSNWAILSFMGRVNYAYQDRFLVTLTGRQDGSSRLAKGNEWDFFPSGALAWRISQESFMEAVPEISNLKLRFSWGNTGNTAISPYETLGLLGRRTYVFGDAGSPAIGYIPAELANQDLGWERTEEYNIGLDIGVFNNRVIAILDLYERNTRDLLMERRIPVTSGFSSTWQNIGQVQNRGIELALNAIPVQTQDWFWDLRFAFAHNQNRIIDLYGDKQDDIGNLWFIGHPVDVEFIYTWDGVWQFGEEEEAARYGRVPGESRIVDVNDDGIYGNEDRTIYNRIPRYTGGISSELRYKNWDLNMYIYGRFDYQQRLGVLTAQQGAGSTRWNHLRVDFWTPDNPTNEHPRPTADANPFLSQTTYALRDLSFIRLKNINLGYTFPREFTQRIRIQNLRAYLMIDNPYIWHYEDSPALDHETSRAFSNHPPITSFLLGLNITF